ncbi:DUF5615 family PIN-like protein [Candidatus Woesearchaeota archaeon]|nr:DUF5615 family PIN-like protein [Candidatus Woesearchaeota archaeon]
MSLSQTKFLLDENVHSELYAFLRRRGSDVILVKKGTADLDIAKACFSEGRVLVTNDSDFVDERFRGKLSVLLLRFRQGDVEPLIRSSAALENPPAKGNAFELSAKGLREIW